MTKREFIASLQPSDVMSVYSGKNGQCCCGCSGKHTTNPLHKALSGEERGYVIDDEDCNAKTVKMILNKIKRNVEDKTCDWQEGDFVSVVIGQRDTVVLQHGYKTKRYEYPGRLYVAYLVPSDEDIKANRKRRAETKESQRVAKLEALQGVGI